MAEETLEDILEELWREQTRWSPPGKELYKRGLKERIESAMIAEGWRQVMPFEKGEKV